MQRLRVNHFRYRQTFFWIQQRKEQKKSVRATFFDFGLWKVEESDNVENYRFLENCSMEFAENQQKKSVSKVLSPPIIKTINIGSENLPIFFDFICADRQNFQKIDFLKLWFSHFWYLQLKEYLKVTTHLDFQRIPSSSFRETDNFRLCPISQLSTGRNRKKWLVHFLLCFFLCWMQKNVCRYLKWLPRNRCTKFGLT